MKRSDRKIGSKSADGREKRIRLKKKLPGLTALLILLGLTACEKAWHGRDGRPGNAWLSLTWQVTEPTYLDAGTGAIPPVFQWGEYYRIQPGSYFIYYEGRVWTGMYWAWYAWEVQYDIWRLPGEPGDWYCHGANGPDNFFNIECNPNGPYISNYYKSADDSPAEIIEYSEGDIIQLVKEEGGFELKVTYTKVAPKSENITEQGTEGG